MALEGSEKPPVKIFYPHNCLSCPSGYLIGWKDEGRGFCCVTGIVHADLDHIKCSQPSLQPWQIRRHDQLHIVGLWYNSRNTDLPNNHIYLPQECHWVNLYKCDSQLPKCSLQGQWCHKFHKMIVVIYDARSLMDSYFLKEIAWKDFMKTSEPNYKPLSNSRQEDEQLENNVELLSKGLLIHKKHSHILKQSDLVVSDCLQKSILVQDYIQDVFHMIIFKVFDIITGIAAWLKSIRMMEVRVIRTLIELPAMLCQLCHRQDDLRMALDNIHNSPTNTLRYKNAVSRHVVDVCVGVVLMLWLTQGGHTVYIAEALMTWADNVVSELQKLLHWLMGFPAGLKLNSQLDHFLGRFFLYHIYLWTGYLHILRPILSDALWYISLTGCMGVSAQLCLVQDLLSMMTLHIYCFYVYAARLYSLQMYALASLWRLFRGKKWNVLRERVDSALYDVDQLFIGTLLFTVLLFLLPTTALYYVVFTGLRLVVLFIQGTLHKIVQTINSLPVYSLLLWQCKPQSVSDNVKFYVLPHPPDRPLYLSMQLMTASLRWIWKQSSVSSYSTRGSHSWGDLGHRLLWGHLIYPWIQSNTH